ncbi:hypothetical protein B0T10DRAFT_467367 [Thelonectria olida]|uniref:Zn(2)-C6 fungal-type domain-containing protein n=1 Tax=Thelonectria olida TaxID=1576542 RepID=A0A9P8VR39_9HYPO|nr:hypothetical protein B0T10DRAFT_467367 [Thelonectria olida]
MSPLIELTLSQGDGCGLKSPSSIEPEPLRRFAMTRSRKGCVNCKRAKTKCDNAMPCQRCMVKGIECKLKPLQWVGGVAMRGRLAGSLIPVKSIEHPVKSIEHPVESIEHPVESIERYIKHLVDSIEHPVKPGDPVESIKRIKSIKRLVDSAEHHIGSIESQTSPKGEIKPTLSDGYCCPFTLDATGERFRRVSGFLGRRDGRIWAKGYEHPSQALNELIQRLQSASFKPFDLTAYNTTQTHKYPGWKM